MGLNPRRRASLVSGRELSGIVETAIKAAALRPGGGVSGGLIRKWELVGRRAKTFDQGQTFAAAVSAELRNSGIDASPAVLGIGKEILCGFIERGNLPQSREL